jgi:hypothetical protein
MYRCDFMCVLSFDRISGLSYRTINPLFCQFLIGQNDKFNIPIIAYKKNETTELSLILWFHAICTKIAPKMFEILSTNYPFI